MVDYIKPSGLEKVWAATGVKTPAPDASKISAGWVVEIPPREYFNYLENKQDAFIAHINQKGGVVWDNTTEYLANTSYAMGSNGILYKCLISNTNINPVTDVAGNWRVAYYFTTDVYTKVESDAKYLTKLNNLSDIGNTATARTNLSVYSKAETDAKYTTIANNLSDINAPTARANLNVYSYAESDSRYPLKSNNLSDINAPTARANLSVSSTSEANNLYTAKSSNLSDVANVSTARANLNVYSKAESNSRYLFITSNLGDVPDPTIARTNLSVYSKSEADASYLTYTGNLSGLVSPLTAFNNIKQAASDSYAGVSQFSSDAELLAGTVSDKSVAPSKLKLGFSVNLASVGHFKFPAWLGGLIINWGNQSISANATVSPTKSTTFTEAFCVVCSSSNTGGDIAPPHAYTVGSEIFLVNTDNGGMGINWFAIGR